MNRPAKGTGGARPLVPAVVLAAGCVLLLGGSALAREVIDLPSGGIGAAKPGQVATVLQILLVLTVISLAPAILMMMTCFTRIVIVLSFLRRALATQQLPPDQIIVGLALFLSAVGIYGVLAYSVSQRTRELGIRMAVGSSPEDAFRLVLNQGLRVIGVGLVIGLASALGLGRLIRSLLFGVGPADPLVLGSVAVILLMVGVAACVFPARRATRVDPVIALNQE